MAVEISKGTKATPDYLWTQMETYGIHFPQVIYSGTKSDLYKYHPTYSSGKIGLPFSIAIDLRTMKVTDTKTGKATLAQINAAAKLLLD